MAFPKTKRKQQGLLDSRNIVIVILQVVGAIDGVQIEVIGPANDSRVDYFNRKHYSIDTQTTTGANLVLFDHKTGFPGSRHYMILLFYDTQICIEMMSKGEY